MIDVSRLLTQLNNTGLQNKDTPLYQFLKSLLTTIRDVNSTITNNVGNVTNITQLLQYFISDSDGSDGGNELFVPGIRGDQGSQGIQGPIGPMGAIIFPPDAEDGDIFPPQTGPQGNPGPQGTMGNIGPAWIPNDGEDGEPAIIVQVTQVGNSGALALLEQHSASGSTSLDFTSWFSSTYDEYLVELINLIPATDAVNLLLRFSTDGGSTYDSGNNYQWAGFRASKAGSAAAGATATSSIGLDSSGGQSNTTANAGVCGCFRIFNPASTTFHKKIKGEIGINDGTSNPDVTVMVTGAYTVTGSAVNAFRLLESSGNIASGTVRIYGIAKS